MTRPEQLSHFRQLVALTATMNCSNDICHTIKRVEELAYSLIKDKSQSYQASFLDHVSELIETDQGWRVRYDSLKMAVTQTIMENLNLADGDQCTLKRLKDAIRFELPDCE
jgi:hypothetical protein